MAEPSDEALDADLAQRLKAALASYQQSAAPNDYAELMSRIVEAHAQASAAMAGSGDGAVEPELAWAKTYLDDDQPGLKRLREMPSRLNADGDLIGHHRYEKHDPHLLETLIQYLEHPRKFETSFAGAPEISLPENTSLAIAGDWATGYWQGDATAAKRVADRMAKAEFTIHLGDTYYAGRPDEVDEHLGRWPKAKTDRAFALRGNHEMYCKGGAPFMTRLPIYFPAQAVGTGESIRGVTCFSMTNANWLVLALDTAYFARPMFLRGTIGPETGAQWRFAARQLALAKSANRRVILLTHHPPFDLARQKHYELHEEVCDLFSASLGKPGPELWAWGHLHNAAVYTSRADGFRGRLVGHGAYPYGRSSRLDELQAVPAEKRIIEWHETISAGDGGYYEKRVVNGFLWIDLNGRDAKESMWGELGDAPHWSSPI